MPQHQRTPIPCMGKEPKGRSGEKNKIRTNQCLEHLKKSITKALFDILNNCCITGIRS